MDIRKLIEELDEIGPGWELSEYANGCALFSHPSGMIAVFGIEWQFEFSTKHKLMQSAMFDATGWATNGTASEAYANLRANSIAERDAYLEKFSKAFPDA